MDSNKKTFIEKLNSIDFFRRYGDICDKYRFAPEFRLEKPDVRKLEHLMNQLGFEVKYYKKEKAFRVWPGGGSYEDPSNLFLSLSDIDIGRVTLNIAAKIDDKYLGGPISWFSKKIGQEPQGSPGFRTYEEFYEVFAALIPIYEDMRTAFATVIDRD